MTTGNPPVQFPTFPKIPLRAPGQNPADAASEDIFLGAVQGNILKGHGREHLRLVPFRFSATAESAGLFLRRAAADRGTVGRDRWVLSALDQLAQRKVHHLAWQQAELLRLEPTRFHGDEMRSVRQQTTEAEEQLFGGLLLTRAGLRHLGRSFPESESFTAGLKSRMSETLAADEMDAAPYNREDTPGDFHGMFLLACDDPDALDTYVKALRHWSAEYQTEIFSDEVESGFAWRNLADPYGNRYQPPREPFGFADGISQPLFFAEERLPKPMREGQPNAWDWTDLSLDQVFIPTGEHAGGSFVALLKIEQNVAAFRAYEASVAGQLVQALGLSPGIAEYLAPAVLMGRTRQGYPLGEVLAQLAPNEAGLRTLFPASPPPNPAAAGARPPQAPAWLNEFDFQAHTADRVATPRGCPFHVHLRKMNPRAEGDFGTRKNLVAAQLVRRGATYDPKKKLTAAEEGTAPWPAGEVGLLFLAYMRDLGVQFEQAHTHWAPDTGFPEPGGPDPVLSPAPALKFGGIDLPPMPRVIRRRGGVYLYAPSLTWLRHVGLS